MPFKLGQTVRIKTLGVPDGTVIGICDYLYGTTQFLVRSVDSTGRPIDVWWYAQDLIAA
jgi:hypothetical protein